MIKRIDLKIEDLCVVAYLNENQLFRLSNENKTINIEELYKKMAITKDDSIENLIVENTSSNKSSLEVLYDNTKLFLDELIKRINEVLTQFDFEKEKKILINQ